MSNLSLVTQNLYQQMQSYLRESSTIYILSSFIMDSGVKLIYDDLEYAVHSGADVKILTGDYLYVTQPKALKKLTSLQAYENFDMKLWQSSGHSFHPKTYLFKHNEDGTLVIGSSNLSRSALTTGLEWNIKIDDDSFQHVFKDALSEFIALFHDSQTLSINDETIKDYEYEYDLFHAKHPDLNQKWTEREEIELTLPTSDNSQDQTTLEDNTNYESKIPEPRPAQQIALSALNETIEEGYTKGVVSLATGLGKTYVSAFFAQRYSKVLFIAHRDEILQQAKKSFEHVLNETAGIYNGSSKEKDSNLTFASIQTLSIQDNLEQFDKDEFDLIVIDEFHHAAANTYRKVINYFQPSFLLGLTATPERTDGQDILALCEGNLVCDISFIDAIRKGWLSPFHYYGVLDDIDYSQIRWLGTQYDQEQLMHAQLQNERAEHLYYEWLDKRQTRTIAFCSTIKQAKFLSNYFINQNSKATVLTGQSNKQERHQVINQLERGEIDIIFTVDLFNEGIDIPPVDTLLFARPTESLVVFTQQIGRGLRTFAGKDHCVIIDLIGNYRYAETKLKLLNDNQQNNINKQNNIEPVTPTNCLINLQTEVIDLLAELKRKSSPIKEQIYNDYIQIKKVLGKRPTYKESHLYGTIDSKLYKTKFGGYFAFLKAYNELTDNEIDTFNQFQTWLQKLESEQMQKSYKMIVLNYLLSKGVDQWLQPVTPDDVEPYFRAFYLEKDYRKYADFPNQKGQKPWEMSQSELSRLIATMPMTKWTTGNDQLAVFENNTFYYNLYPNDHHKETLFNMTQQICEYKLHRHIEKRAGEIE